MRYRGPENRINPPGRGGNSGRPEGPRNRVVEKPVPNVSIPERGDAWTEQPAINPPSVPNPEPPAITNQTVISQTKPYQVKPASKDIVLFDDENTSIETMADLIFEDIGGNELLNISRFDMVISDNTEYQPIKNITYIKQAYGPNNLFSLQNTSDKIFGNFPIKLNNKVSTETTLDNIYRDSETGGLVLEFINMSQDEEIEIQIASNGIIYEVDNYDN